MAIKVRIYFALSGIIATLFLQSCATNLEIGTENSVAIQEALVKDFITAAYRQNPKKLQIVGVNIDEVSKYLSSDYSRSLAILSKEYQSKKSVFSDFDQTTLERTFTSEINFALLRPWSYQPNQKFVSTEIKTDTSEVTKVEIQYSETRWGHQFTACAVVALKSEREGLRIDDICWKDTYNEKSVRNRINEVAQALRNSKDMSDFEKRTGTGSLR